MHRHAIACLAALLAATPASAQPVAPPGADPTGAADSTAAIQAGIDGLCAQGGGTLELPGTFRITETLHVRCSNLHLIGLGHGQLHADNSWDARSRLVWAGIRLGTLISFAPAPDTRHGKGIAGSDATGILFDCAGIAATCLHLGSVRDGTWHVAYNDPAATPQGQASPTAGLVLDTVDLSEYNDTQHNDIWVHGAELGAGGKGILLQATSRNNMITPAGSATPVRTLGNTSYNRFHIAAATYWRGTGITLRETDNNVFDEWAAGGPFSVPRGIAGPPVATASSVEIEGTDDPAFPFPAISNVFVHGAAAGPVIARGTPSFRTPSGFVNGVPNPNLFIRLDTGNQPASPVVERGAYAYFGSMLWIDDGRGLTRPEISDDAGAIQAMRLSGATGRGAFTPGGAVLHATHGPTARLASPDLQSVWQASVDDAGRLAIRPLQHGTQLALEGSPVTVMGRPVVRLAAPPAHSTSPCAQGEIAADATWLYVCIAADTWKRDAHAQTPW